MKPLALAISIALLAPQAASQTPSSEAGDKGFTLSVGVQLVSIPVTVVGAEGLISDKLTQSNFDVFEDNVRQEITFFKHEDLPLRTGVVINGFNNAPDLKAIVNSATSTFIRESNPNNETFILDFDGPLYYRKQKFVDGIAGLVDAFIDVNTFRRPASANPDESSVKKAVVVVVEGSRISATNMLLTYLKETGEVAIYAIGLIDEKQKSSAKVAREQLTQFAEQTGGEAYFPKSVDEVDAICKRIAHDMRNRYTLGYSPKNTKNDGAWRAIRVTVRTPLGATIPVLRARQGYFAPR